MLLEVMLLEAALVQGFWVFYCKKLMPLFCTLFCYHLTYSSVFLLCS